MTVLSGVLMCLVLASVPAGGPGRAGPLTVLHDAVTLRLTEGSVLVGIPVQTHVLTPQVTLKATVSLVDQDEKVHAEGDVLRTVGTGPATLQLTLETTSAPEALRDCQLRYRVRSMHPPGEVEGATAVASLLALESGGPSRPGRLVVLGDAITMALTQDGLEVAIPVQMDAHGLVSALKELAARAEKQSGIGIELQIEKPVLISHNETATHVYRIVQEAINNAIKHAQAKRITMTLQADEYEAVIDVRDDGRGLPEDAHSRPGLGFRIMFHRCKLFGGSLDIYTHDEGGTHVRDDDGGGADGGPRCG